MNSTTKILLLSALGLAGCTSLPDQQLANEALKRGDTATAERHYRQLAELGYADAAVGLADLQVASRDPEQLRKAEQTYRSALDSSPRAKARLGKLLAAKVDASDAERREAEKLLSESFEAGEQSALLPLTMLYLQYPQLFPGVNLQQRIAQWRAEGYPQAEMAQVIYYRSQGTYDQHLGEIEQICQRMLNQMDVCYVELATVYQKREQADQQKALIERLMSGYRAGTVSANRVDGVAGVLANSELGKTDEKTAQELLEEIAPKYPAAWVSLARLLYEYPELGDADKMMEYLDQGRAAAQPRAELLLGKLYYEGKLVPMDPFKAEEHLTKAAETELSAHYYLGQLYRRGFLGKVYPQKALDHLLYAARGGQNSADFALAQMFSQGRGIKIDRVNAYVFGQLAILRGAPQAEVLMQELEPQLLPAERARGDELLRQEKQLRGTAWLESVQMQAMQSQ
ncbi:alginate biosynthesis protein [Pseudomonas sp. PIC25]|uniref:alginate biosynthesis TPR repeat lipoprotein AlgK n=1 Tax=Pseudomonas sp. PIC25 TaxID=1958773 RepID=UPI000BD9B4CE|nr:alginate biosynthesis TPR repeat lipoprotein AlgK [Pseudomonas sp. PIC25]PAU56700.1 alginate biosynthesis protein [Pseudomonas sp. PIC25]